MEHPLRRYRARNSLSLSDVAKLAHTSAATVSRVETGGQAPSFDLIRRICAATGGEVQPNDFFKDSQAA